MPSEELDLINQALEDRVHSYEEAYAQARVVTDRLIKRELGHKAKPITLSENLKLLKSYWDKEYSDRDNADPKSMWNKLNAALRIIGDTSLLTATKEELYEKIKDSGLEANKRRAVIARLNQLLKFAGRFKLKAPKQEFPEIRYLSEKQVLALSASLKGTDRDLVLLAFATGCRLGELFAINETTIKPNGKIWVGYQILRSGKKALPKNRKQRSVFCLEVGRDALKRWLKVPLAERLTIRNRKYAEIVHNACKALWPKQPDKHVSFHDLRHSFAAEMLRLGESVSVVAQLLGDSVQVCQMYYSGFSMHDESMDALVQRMRLK